MSNIIPMDNDRNTPNIFVTQINERDSEKLTKSYGVKESPETLLKTGLNTLQETLVIKKEQELNYVNGELSEKRQINEKAMLQFWKKRQELIVKQQKFHDQMQTFDSFIKENDAKRRRALLKYQSEVRLLEQQNKMIRDLEQDKTDIQIMHERLLNKVKKNKKFEDFLLKVIEFLPQDYIKVTDNVLGGLIMRYNTLLSANETLVSEMMNKSEEGNMYAASLTKMKQNHENELLQSNCRISMMYEEHERLKDQMERTEQNFRLKHVDVRMEVLNFGLILRAIDNITKKCARKFDQSVQENDLDNKIQKIQDYITTTKEIIEMVHQMKDDKIPVNLPEITTKVSLTSVSEPQNQPFKKFKNSQSRSK